MDPRMVLASETINTDKWAQLPNITGLGGGVFISPTKHQVSWKTHTQKSLRPTQRVRTGGPRTQRQLPQGSQVGRNLDRKVAQLVTSLEMLPGIFFPDSLLVLMWPPSPPPTRTGQAMVDAGDT